MAAVEDRRSIWGHRRVKGVIRLLDRGDKGDRRTEDGMVRSNGSEDTSIA